MGQNAVMHIYTQFSNTSQADTMEKGGIDMNFVANKRIILASESPRRQELLAMLGVSFEVAKSNVLEDEVKNAEQSLVAYAKMLAIQKAEAVAKDEPEAVVIGADTIVGMEKNVFPKPKNAKEARQFLRELSGQTHMVVTAVAIVNNGHVTAFAYETNVTFYELDDALIEAYIATGDPLDKAGAYGIQSGGAFFVKEIQGDYYAVMGLPIAMLRKELQALGILSLKGDV